MKTRAGESAQRTIENSPAIYRWEPRKIRYWKSAKRTTEALDANRLSAVSRALCLYGRSFPSTEVLGYFRVSAARTGRRGLLTLTVLTALILTAACQKQIARTRSPLKPPEQETEVRALAPNSSPNLKLIIDGAIEQVGKTTSYDPSYQELDYPNGDVPIETGVCSDVIVRAFRKAGIDLQKDVHEDMQANFSAYPTKWGLKSPDSNIDHRRVPNLDTFFTRMGKSLPTDSGSDNFLPGDIVSWDLGGGSTHIGMVTNVWYKPSQRYLIVHNIGGGTRMEDALFSWKITGHYRYF
jgi:uncharacterized protein